MRNLLLGLIAGIILAVPATAVAAVKINGLPDANEIYQFDNGSGRIEVFDDQGNKCYVARRGGTATEVAISCLPWSEVKE